jgi:hypothetical protein
MRRKSLSKRVNKRRFRNSASRVHKKNLVRRIMRGGIRL